MPNLEELIEQVNSIAKDGAHFLCVHLEPHMIIGPFPKFGLHIAEEFLEHLQSKWPDLEAHIIRGNGIGRTE